MIKKIEKIKLKKDEEIYLEVDQTAMPEMFVNVTLLVEKINELVDAVNKK